MYCSHLHRLTILQPQLFHYVFFCSANFLLCGSISDGANFQLKSTRSGKLIHIGKDKPRSIQMLKKSQAVPFTVRGLSSCRQAMYRQAANISHQPGPSKPSQKHHQRKRKKKNSTHMANKLTKPNRTNTNNYEGQTTGRNRSVDTKELLC